MIARVNDIGRGPVKLHVAGRLFARDHNGVRLRRRFYVCAGCRRLRPWADGASDDRPDLCDACWCDAHGCGRGLAKIGIGRVVTP